MKILMLATHLNTGGITSYILNISRALTRRGHEVYAASSGGELEPVLEREGIRHIRLDIRTKSELSPKVIRAFFKLGPFIKKEGIDLIHAHTRVTQALAALISLFLGTPYVTTCHGFFKNRLGRRIFGCWGRRVVAISGAVKDQLTGDFNVAAEEIHLIHTGIDAGRFLKEATDKEKRDTRRELRLDGSPVIGMIGRLSPVKGQKILIKAAKVLSKDFPSVRILLVGDGPDKARIERLSSDLGIRGNIVFAGSLQDTAKALKAIDVFVMPSIKEGLGLSLAEAMAAGRPCVASGTGGIGALIEDGVTGVLFKTGDPGDLAKAVKYVLDNKDKAGLFGRNAREKVVKAFNMDKMAAETEEMYRSAMSGPAAHKASAGHPKPASRILIFNVNWLGDIVFTSPFIRALRKAFPESHIACAAPPRCREILEANRRLEEVIVYDERGPEKTIFGKLRFVFALKKKRFDTAFILHRSMTRAFITFLAGIKERVGYDTKRRGFILTRSLPNPTVPEHRVEHFLALARAVGADTSNKDYEFFIDERDKESAARILEGSGVRPDERIAVLNPGGNWPPKRWPARRFAELADMLIEKYGLRILITGAEKDKGLADEISGAMKGRAVSLCGKTGIRELAAVLRRAALVVSGDSGPMHIAVGVGANVIAIFGPTSPDITGPYGRGSYTVLRKDVGCEIPCLDTGCRENRCMTAISPGDVMGALERRGYLRESASSGAYGRRNGRGL